MQNVQGSFRLQERGWEPLYFQIQIQWLVRPLNNREFIVMFMILVWDDFWFVAWWKQAYKFGKLWPWWDAYGQQQYATRLWLSSNDLLVLMGLKCVKTFLTPLHHRYQPELCSYMASSIHGFMRSILRFIRPGYVFPVFPVVQSGYMSYIAFLSAHTNLAHLHRPLYSPRHFRLQKCCSLFWHQRVNS